MAFIASPSTTSLVWVALFGTVALLVKASSPVHWLALAGIAVVPAVLARLLCRTSAVTVRVPAYEARR